MVESEFFGFKKSSFTGAHQDKKGFLDQADDGVLFLDEVREIRPIATIDAIQCAEQLPKRRSGKIMRRILKKIAIGETDTLGDLSTIADPSIIDVLIENAEIKN